jgi:hypothetical protein
VITEVAVAGQPDPSLHDAELAAEPAQTQGVSGIDAVRDGWRGRCRATVPIQLRIHHQSPVRYIAMIVAAAMKIQ